jgi:tetratricopeptide (TPR) repeat protein
MVKRLASALLTAGLLLAADTAFSTVWSKPPDLPIDTKEMLAPLPPTSVGYATLDESTEVATSEDDADSTPVLVDVLNRFFDALCKGLFDNSTTEGEATRESTSSAERRRGLFDSFTCTTEGEATHSRRSASEAPPQAVESIPPGAEILPPPCNDPDLVTAQQLGATVFGIGGAIAASGVGSGANPLPQSHQVMAAARLYQIGVRCEAQGDWDMARNCFEEVSRICPGSEYATKAAAKLEARTVRDFFRGLDPIESGTEMQEAPPAEKPNLIEENRSSLQRIQESRRMYLKGERYENAHQFQKAYSCYNEARAICPACRYGRQSLERMMYLELHGACLRGVGGDAEEQEPPLRQRRQVGCESGSQTFNAATLAQRQQARALYLLGERCRRNGDPRMAAEFYSESSQACPNCFYGVSAQERLQLLSRTR